MPTTTPITVLRVFGDKPEVELDLSVFKPGVDCAVGEEDAVPAAPLLVALVTTSTTVDEAGFSVGWLSVWLVELGSESGVLLGGASLC